MTHPVDTHVGERIRQYRIRNALSQGDLATALGVSFQQVQKYEAATNRVSASRLYDIAAYLGVEIADFYDGYA